MPTLQQELSTGWTNECTSEQESEACWIQSAYHRMNKEVADT